MQENIFPLPIRGSKRERRRAQALAWAIPLMMMPKGEVHLLGISSRPLEGELEDVLLYVQILTCLKIETHRKRLDNK